MNNNIKPVYVKKIEVDGAEQEEEIYFKNKKTYRFSEAYMTLFQGEFMKNAIKLESIKEIFGTRTHLLFYLLSEMDCTNSVRKTRKEICSDIGINEQQLSKQIKKLKDTEMITVQNHNIVFNELFVTKGQVRKHSRIQNH